MCVALTLSFMPLAMSSGLAMTHSATVGMPDMGHCAGEHETSLDKESGPDKPSGGMIDCAIACAAVSPTAPQMMACASHPRQILASQPSTRSEEHTTELQSLMTTSYTVLCL